MYWNFVVIDDIIRNQFTNIVEYGDTDFIP
jgi:hypothetical protein